MLESSADQTFVVRSPELLSVGRSQLLIVDVQEKLLPVIAESDRVLETIGFLQQAAHTLHVPIFLSEQYPKGLGATVSLISNHESKPSAFEKLRFSAADGFQTARRQSLPNADERRLRDQVVVVGIEAHICVLQTALDLIARGVRVFVVADAVGSRNPNDCDVALKRIRDSGGVVCTAQSVAFEWCEVAGSDEFRQISRLVRGRTAS